MEDPIYKLLGIDPKLHDNMDERWRPFLEKKVVVILKPEEGKKKGRKITGYVQHYGLSEIVHILVSQHKCVDIMTFDACESVELFVPKPTRLQNEDLKLNRWYRAVRPQYNPFIREYNDRQIIWIGGDHVQYDSISVRFGHKRPIISIEQFLRWAGSDVTEIVRAEIAKEQAEEAALRSTKAS